MLHWYGGSPVVVPKPEENFDPPPLYGGDPARFKIPMEHLLIWGERDQALLPSSTARLEDFAPRLTRVVLDNADHWLLHTHSKAVAREIRQFLES